MLDHLWLVWYQNHSWLLATQSWKITLDLRPKKWGKCSILYARFEKKSTFGGSQLIIGQKSGWNVRNERRILRKSIGGGGSLAFFITFGIKTTLDYLSKKSKRGVLCIFDTFWDPNDSWLSVKKVKNMLDNIGAFWGKNMSSRGKEGLEHFWWKGVLRICGTGREGGGRVFRICGIFWDLNHNLL